MKKIFLFINIFFLTVQVFSQPEFKISVEKFEWIPKDDITVYLKIYLKITNISNTPGKCDDVNNIFLDCLQEFHKNRLNLIDQNKNLLMIIDANDFRTGFITFSVPVFADSLTLKLKNYSEDETTKFLTESYYKTVLNKPNDKVESLISEANLNFEKGYFSVALYYYLKAVDIKSDKMSILKTKISTCYDKIGEAYLDSNNYRYALSSFKNAIKINDKAEYRSKAIKVLELLGDEELKLLKFGLAESYYKECISLKSDNTSCRSKIAKLYEIEGDKYYKAGFFNAASDKYYESLKYFFNQDVYLKYEDTLEKSK